MSCCGHCTAADTYFGPEVARRDIERYRRRGPNPTTRLLLEGIRATDLRDGHLLDVGAGVGVLHHELLDKSVGTVTHVEAASAYSAAARREDARRGWQGRVRYLTGDAVDLEAKLPPADIVTLDRVLCCYPEWEPLVRITAQRATRYYAYSAPHDRWYVRAGFSLRNLQHRLRGRAFRAFVHPVGGVDGLLDSLGFRRRYLRRTVVWRVALYERRDAA